MAYKLTKNIASNKSFRWGTPIRKYEVATISQAKLKELWDKGCHFVTEESKPTKKIKNVKSEANTNEA